MFIQLQLLSLVVAVVAYRHPSREAFTRRRWSTDGGTQFIFNLKNRELHSANSGTTDSTTSSVPSGLREASDLLRASLSQSLSLTPPKKLLSLDLLTPGLNPKLENKAVLYQEYLFDIVTSIIPVIKNEHDLGRFRSAKFMFGSTGEAAGFQKYCYKMGISIPDCLGLTDLDGKRIEDTDDCVVFIAARNNVGDPVLSMIRKIASTFPEITYVFLNCDLSDRVASGMQDRSAREAFRSSISPSFYFRNIVQTSRPSLVPFELGAVLFTPSRGWEIHAVNQDDIPGSGSLNRFMVQGVFKRNPRDPTSSNPPRFILAGKYDFIPKIGEIDATMARAAFQLAKAARATAKSNLYAPGGDQIVGTPVMPSSLPLALPAVTSEDDAIDTLFKSVARSGQSDSSSESESAMRAAAALCFLDDFYGCSPTTQLPPSPSSRTRGREQGWGEIQTPVQTAVVKKDGTSGTSSSDITSNESQSSSGGAKQRPGVFDINTGSTAFPASPETQATLDALVPLRTSGQKVSVSSKQDQQMERSGAGKAPTKARQIGWTAGEQKLLQLFTSPNKAGSRQPNPASRRGVTWEVAYSVSSGDDGVSQFSDEAAEGAFGSKIVFTVTAEGDQSIPSSPLTSNAAADDLEEVSASDEGWAGWEGSVTRSITKWGVPFVSSTGAYTSSPRSVSRTAFTSDLTGNTEGDTSSASSSSSTSSAAAAESRVGFTKSRVLLELSFSSMQYLGLGFFSQRAASSSDAKFRLELVAVLQKNGVILAVVKDLRKDSLSSSKKYAVWKRVGNE